MQGQALGVTGERLELLGVKGSCLTVFCPTSCVQSFQLQLQAPSGDTVPAQGGLPMTQLLRILNPNKVSCRSPGG